MSSLRAVLSLTLALAAFTEFVSAQAASAAPAERTVTLLLDTIVNGAATNTITSFVQFPDGALGASARDLSDLGLKIDDHGRADELIRLSDVPSLTYRYNERTQQISITVDNDHLRPHVLDVRSRNLLHPQTPRSDWGAVVDYDLFSAANDLDRSQAWRFGGASLSLDGRAFSPFGVFEQTGLASVDPTGRGRLVRLNTTFTYSDPAHLDTWTLGDTINGSTAWSRPIRIGGFQLQSNFALRPDLVTTPLASLGGTAAVPSTVDLYVNNIRTYSQDVGSGPFNLVNVPLTSGPGTAQVVIRSASGQTITANLPFFGSVSLLAPGLSSWSLEAGLPRTAFGATADSYAPHLAVSATWLHGATSWLTFGGHGEAGAGVVNGAVDLTFKTGALGVASASFTESSYRGKSGSQLAFDYQTAFRGINLTAGMQRSLGDYEDLASATARLASPFQQPAPLVYLNGLSGTTLDQAGPNLYPSARAPIQIDHVTAGGAFGADHGASWSLSYVLTTLATGQRSEPLSMSYSRALTSNASLSATVSRDFANRNSSVFLVSFNMALGSRSVSAGVSGDSTGATSTLQASRPLGLAPGSVGWSVRDSEGAQPFREVDGAIRTASATFSGGVQNTPAGASSTFEAAGAITTIGGHAFLSDRIDDAFAVVDAGAPGVMITSENRPIGKTDRNGMLLAPTLRSYQNNSLEMDPTDLPVDVQIQSTRLVVTPAEHAGVMVTFRIQHDAASALVTFVDDAGHTLPVGSEVRVNRAGKVVLGYDGQAFIEDLKPANAVIIDTGTSTCLASFAFEPVRGKQVQLGPVVCRRETIATAPAQGGSNGSGQALAASVASRD